jgi:DNA-binding NarL/FixJ family response regulator
MRCLVVDDDANACELLTHLLGRAGHSIAIAPSGPMALEMVRNQDFDIALVDLQMEDMDGATTMRALRDAKPDLRMLVVSGYDDREHVLDAVAAGADGYLLKTELSSRLPDAMSELMAGGGPLSARIASIVLDQLRRPPEGTRPGGAEPTATRTLSKREFDVLEGLSRGYTYTEIAANLQISVNTVRHHIRNLYDKLGVNGKAEAVSRALGILTKDGAVTVEGGEDAGEGLRRSPRGTDPPPIK